MRKHISLFGSILVMILWGSLFPVVKAGYRAFDVSGIADILLFAGVRFVICGAAISLFSFVFQG